MVSKKLFVVVSHLGATIMYWVYYTLTVGVYSCVQCKTRGQGCLLYVHCTVKRAEVSIVMFSVKQEGRGVYCMYIGEGRGDYPTVGVSGPQAVIGW